MCQVTNENNDDARSVPVPPVTQDEATNDPEDANDDPTASEGSGVRIGNILEEDKKTQRSKMHKSALLHLDIYFREHREPSEDPPEVGFKSFRSFKDVMYEDLRHPSNDFLASWRHILQSMRLTVKPLRNPRNY